MAKKQQTMQGFTIIEVVLVLAIAGLIFLMVFVALPALQRSQRDTQRRNDMARVDTALTQYQTNNQGTGNGNLPAASAYAGAGGVMECGNNAACKFVARYMNAGDRDAVENTFQDPDGAYYSVNIGAGAFVYNGDTMDHTVYIRTGAICQGEDAVAATERHYAVLYRLEGSGVYCIDDQ